MSEKSKRFFFPVSASTPVQSSSGLGQPTSPTRLSQDLQGLNNRLACYINTVRHLQCGNSQLTLEASTSQETVVASTLSQMYNHRLTDAHMLLEKMALEKAKLEIKAKRIGEENEDLKKRLDRKIKEAADYELSARTHEARANELSAKYNIVLSECKKAQDKLKEPEEEVAYLKKQLDALRKKNEEETLARVILENTVRSLREDITLKDQIHQQQLTKFEFNTCDLSHYQEQEELLEGLQDLRDQYHSQVSAIGQEISELYATLNLDLKIERKRRGGINLREGASWIKRQREEYSSLLNEHHELIDKTIKLDVEIAAYDKLLSSEEHRLNITPGSQTTIFNISSAGSVPSEDRRTSARRTSRRARS